MTLLSKRLKQIRTEKKLTQQELADKIGVNRVTYTNWENGNREPELDKVVELATELNCTVDYLLGLDDTNPLDLLQDTEKLKNMSDDELNSLYKKLGENIAFIAEIAKRRFNHSDEDMKKMISLLIESYQNPQ